VWIFVNGKRTQVMQMVTKKIMKISLFNLCFAKIKNHNNPKAIMVAARKLVIRK